MWDRTETGISEQRIDDSSFNKTETKHAVGVSSVWEKREPRLRSLRSTRGERAHSGDKWRGLGGFPLRISTVQYMGDTFARVK